VDLPAVNGASRRSIRARTVNATGAPGQGLTAAEFADNVEYQEDAVKPGGTPRVVRARTLKAGLTADGISTATFSGGVTFTEQGLEAGAADMQYDPGGGLLRLRGAGAGGRPRVSDQQIAVTADTIDVTLEGHIMSAAGSVRTILQPQKGSDGPKLPGLLEGSRAANADGNALKYDGADGLAVYTGSVQLWQGETAIYANQITINRETGDLLAAGAARASLRMDDGTSIGRADEIQYTDARREIEYRAAGAGDADGVSLPPGAQRVRRRGAAGGPAPVVAPAAVLPIVPVQLNGPQGDLKADRIVVLLQKTGSEADRLEGYGNVILRIATPSTGAMRVATGARLTYYAADERYVIGGALGVPVKVVQRCDETTGKTLTFFKSTDRIIVDGNEEIRTQTKGGGGPCPQPRSP
jgi:lipopolysaccharide export system protein LptA